MVLLAGSATASETCTASMFDEGYRHPMADGRRHRPDDILAAHKSLPFGTTVHVTVLATGRSADVPIADRGPFFRGRCIDLSRGAARALGVTGLAKVRVEVVSQIRPSKPVVDQNPPNLIIKPERTSR